MAFDAGAIIAKLQVDNKEFEKGMKESEKTTKSFSNSILSLTVASAAITGVMVAISKQFANYADDSIKAARSTGSNVEEFTKLAHAADLSGVSTESLTTSMQFLNKSLVEASKDGSNAQKTFQKFGIALKNTDGTMKSSDRILKDISDRYKDIQDPIQRSELAMTAFGRSGMNMASMLELGSEGLNEMGNEAQRLGLVITQEAGEAAEKFNDNISRLSKSIKGFTNSLGESIVELVNKSGILEGITNIIVYVREAYDNLSDTFKDFIVVFPLAIAGIAGLTAAFVGLGTVLTIIGTFLMANPIFLAIAGVTAALVLLATETIRYWSQIKPVIEPISKMFSDLSSGIKIALQPIVEFAEKAFNAFKNMAGISDESDKASGKIAIFGTVAKVILATVVTSIQLVVDGFIVMRHSIALVIDTLGSLLLAFTQLNSGNVVGAYNTITQGTERITARVRELNSSVGNLSTNFQNNFRNMTTPVYDLQEEIDKTKDRIAKLDTSNLDNLKKEMKDLSEESANNEKAIIGISNNTRGALSSLTGEFQSISQQMKDLGIQGNEAFGNINAAIQTIAPVASQAFENLSIGIETAIAKIQRDLQNFEVFSQVHSHRMQKMQEDELASIRDMYDDRIRFATRAEEERIKALRWAQTEAERIRNEEFDAEVRRREQELQARLEQERKLFDIRQARLIEESIVQGREIEVQRINENAWNEYVKEQEALLAEDVSNLRNEFRDNEKEQKDIDREEEREATQEQDEILKNLEAEKNLALEEAQKKHEEQKLQTQKESDAIRYMMELAMMQLSKKQQLMQAKLQLAQNIMGAVTAGIQTTAMLAGLIGPLAVPVGIGITTAMTALAMKGYGMTVAGINAAQVPPPPSLFMEKGGALRGASHAGGGISAELERGEFVLDKGHTNMVYDWIEEGSSGNQAPVINIQNFNPIGNFDRDMVRMLSRGLADEVRRKAVV
jgi:hypothetical protein